MPAHYTNPYLVQIPFNSCGSMPEFLKEWMIICNRDPDSHTHSGATARLQDDLYFRCHYKHKGHVYTCICKRIPFDDVVKCRIEPAGPGPYNWDSLTEIDVPRDDDTVWWDTDHNEISDKTRHRIGKAINKYYQ